MFEAFNPNEMVANLLVWDKELGNACPGADSAISVADNQAATVGQLKAAVERATGVSQDKQRLIVRDERRAVVVTLSADDVELRREFNFRSGEDVVLEVRIARNMRCRVCVIWAGIVCVLTVWFVQVLDDGEPMDGDSPTVHQFDLERNVITICYNLPDAPNEVDQTVPSNRNHTLSQLKAMVATYVKLLVHACLLLSQRT